LAENRAASTIVSDEACVGGSEDGFPPAAAERLALPKGSFW
jgi:hypothetical protein